MKNNKNGVDKYSLLRAIRKFTFKYLLKNSNDNQVDEKLFEYLKNDQGLWLYHKDDNDTVIQKRINEFDTINTIFENNTDVLFKDTIAFYNILTGVKLKQKSNKDNDDEDEEVKRYI